MERDTVGKIFLEVRKKTGKLRNIGQDERKYIGYFQQDASGNQYSMKVLI